MIIKVAWRNIWRNKVRSLVVITAVALGLWAGVFTSGFVNGMMKQKVDAVIKSELSHFQIHQPGFREELKLSKLIHNVDEIYENLQADSLVESFTKRTISTGMLATASSTGSVKIVGIIPQTENELTQMAENITEGKYFEGIKRNPILISERLAEKYKVKLRSKVVLTSQDLHGEITSASFRVVGLYKTNNSMYDEMNVFVQSSDLKKILDITDGEHEIAVMIKSHEMAEQMANTYQGRFPDLEIKPWLDLAPGMRYMVDSMDTYTVIVVGIIMLALLFSIINTMLMAVLERVKEIGMLMAIGMKGKKVFSMVILETIFLSLIGGPLGLLLAWLSITYFGSKGINLSGAAYEEVGFASIVYPYLLLADYLKVAIMVFVMSILASLYPAWKAIKLNPVEAIRKI